jgi:hypothetical protein
MAIPALVGGVSQSVSRVNITKILVRLQYSMVMMDDCVPQRFSFWFLGKLHAMLQVGEDRFKSRIVLVK